MAHYINSRKVASSPGSIPDNIIFSGGYPTDIGEMASFAVEKAHALSTSAGSNKRPVYFNIEGRPIPIDFIPADIENIQNGNLLINPNFKVNQRGLTKYVSGYCVDRWSYFNPNSEGNVTVSENGITLNGEVSNTATRPYIKQFIEPERINENAIHTLSISIDGKIYSGSGVLTTKSSIFLTDAVADNIRIGVNYDTKTNTYRMYAQSMLDSFSFTINWVKLEDGATVTHFIPPDPTLELIKCQRYYKVLNPARISATSFNSNKNELQFAINDCIGDMRIVPTVSVIGRQAETDTDIDGVFWIQINGNGSDAAKASAGTTYSARVVEKSIVVTAMVPISITALTGINHTMIFSANTGIICDAEIY